MAVTRADIQRIAELAELHVDDAAAAELEGQLSPAAAAAGTEAALRLRRDEVGPDPLEAPPASFAPALKGGLFLVPKVAELAPGAADE